MHFMEYNNYPYDYRDNISFENLKSELIIYHSNKTEGVRCPISRWIPIYNKYTLYRIN